MDHSLVILLTHRSLLLTLWACQDTQALQYPTFRHWFSKDVKGDTRRRKKHEDISLKPPPQDWPEPRLATGDFLVEEPKVEALPSTTSPLLAYQAKLEQEYLKQQQDESHGAGKHYVKQEDEVSKWSSSEEDLKKLLDPDELVKHNKQLRPFVDTKIGKAKAGSSELQGVKDKAVAALKVAGARRTRRRMKSAVGRGTTKPTARRGRRKKLDAKELRGDRSSSKKRRVNSKTSEVEETKLTKRRKVKRTFAFANRAYQRSYQDPTTERARTLGADGHGTVENFKYKVTPTTGFLKANSSTQDIHEPTILPSTIETQLRKEDSMGDKLSENKALNETEENGQEQLSNSKKDDQKATTPKGPTDTTTASSQVSTTELQRTSSIPEVTTAFSAKKNEIREKRKEVRKEMEKVLKAEDLEGSFGDKDSDWTSSEHQKIPIHKVTPRHALLGILKHKVVDFIDNVLRENSKPTKRNKLIKCDENFTITTLTTTKMN